MAAAKVQFAQYNPRKRDESLKDTYLVLYGSGYLALGEGRHNAGSAFKLVAEGRHAINKKKQIDQNCVIPFCPTDKDFFLKIKLNKRIKRLDIYSHAWQHGINLGGFTGKRTIDGKEYDGDSLDWTDDVQDGGRDLRRVEIHEDQYITGSSQTTELGNLESDSFVADCEVYFWGCNAGGQLTSSGKHVTSNEPYIEEPKETFAQEFALKMGKGSVYALVGKGIGAGSMFKTDKNGKNIYSDGEMLPANIALNHSNKNTVKLDAMNYMKKFPL
ncbi:hypothetical protein [uncultured Marixanthomonas sp.]|uniref:hypothetical protein n=1 Tax=uncultured Marixanthomonas sp. TaxID=757245 RepID=UPI0030D9B60C|tara:strand:- start:178095 stop:178910 length:816 start_codon:yes stop_codon:yes gene_type:complete